MHGYVDYATQGIWDSWERQAWGRSVGRRRQLERESPEGITHETRWLKALSRRIQLLDKALKNDDGELSSLQRAAAINTLYNLRLSYRQDYTPHGEYKE